MRNKVNAILLNIINSKKAFCIMLVVFMAVCIIPLIWIGKYNVMSADDFSYGIEVHNTWMSTNSLWECIKAACNVVSETYFSWQGTYSSIFVMALNPLIFDESLGILIPTLFIVLYSISTFYFIKCCCQNIDNHCDFIGVFAISITEIIVFILSIDSPVDGFFWYNGATHYMFMHAFMLFYLAIYIDLNRILESRSKVKKIFAVSFMLITALIVGGGNYISVLQCVEITIILSLIKIVTKKLTVWHIMGGIILGIGFLFSVIAPGNSIRQGSGGMGAIEAIINSFVVATKDIQDWITPMFVVGMLMITPILYKLSKNVVFRFKYPILIILLEFCLYASLYAPCLYGVSNADSGRMRNIIQASFYLYVIVAMFYLCGYIRTNTEKSDKIWKKDFKDILTIVHKYRMPYLWTMLILMLLVIVSTGDKNFYSSVSAFRSIVIGEAREYHNQAVERQKIIESEEMDIYLEPFSVKPHVLFYSDYVSKDDINNWINRTAARYYGKNSIQLK